VGGILLLDPAAGTVCINLNGNCDGAPRLTPLSRTLRPPLPLLLLEQLTTFRCLLSRGALLISRDLHHLFPARAVVDDDLTLSPRKLRINVGRPFARRDRKQPRLSRRTLGN